MNKLSSVLLWSCLCFTTSFAMAADVRPVDSTIDVPDPTIQIGGATLFYGIHVGSQAATHMQLKNASGSIICFIYDTPAHSAPVIERCPFGTYTEQLFDINWMQIAPNLAVEVGASNPPVAEVLHRNTNSRFTQFQNVASQDLNIDALTDEIGIEIDSINSDPNHPYDGGPTFLTGALGDGNFRATCQWSHFSYDDPIVFPGQPGAAHLHMFYGNTETNAFTTTDSLVNSGGGTCNGFELNRSAYWSPALTDGAGNAALPYQIMLYYKTKKITDDDGNILHQASDVQQMPQGLKLIAGNTTTSSFEVTQHLFWSCGANGERVSDSKTNMIPNCGSEPINASIYFPQCWDGVNLEPVNDVSHVAQVNVWEDCPANYPHRLPQLGILLYWPAQPTNGWFLSSDHHHSMRTGEQMIPGGTLHADWIGGWNNDTQDLWLINCLRAEKNCTLGQTATPRTLKRLNGNQSDNYMGPYFLPIPAM